ncbi:helix-turn-helix domain-containing protein [[Clostridium] polysaccharolyticum]|nr:AraC family transcriptional regulator [[Clostridium] polysaccharolyticum]
MIEQVYVPMLNQTGFVNVTSNSAYTKEGQYWELKEEVGKGTYWVYHKDNLFNIKIHDFFFHKDTFLEFDPPNCLSITYYSSIAGEELSPYRRLNAGCVKTFIGGYRPYRALIHKNIPIQSIGIEIMPAYYEDYLKEEYPEEYANPKLAFFEIDETMHFPEMIYLLNQVKNYQGEGLSAKLFYESKVAEAVSLVVEHQKKQKRPKPQSKLSIEDAQNIATVTAYLNDHYANELPLEQLAKIACMGLSKFKSLFKQVNGCSVTEYVQQRKMSRAEYLLSSTTLTITQISEAIGYSNPSRFAELFKKSTGLVPGEYRKITQK